MRQPVGECVRIGSSCIVKRQLLSFIFGYIYTAIRPVVHTGMVVTHTRNKGDIFADVEFAHNVSSGNFLVSVVIFLYFGSKNWTINSRVYIIKVAHCLLVECEIKVEIVITVAQEIAMFKTIVKKVGNAHISAIELRRGERRHIGINQIGILVQTAIVSVGQTFAFFLPILTTYFYITAEVLSEIKGFLPVEPSAILHFAGSFGSKASFIEIILRKILLINIARSRHHMRWERYQRVNIHGKRCVHSELHLMFVRRSLT